MEQLAPDPDPSLLPLPDPSASMNENLICVAPSTRFVQYPSTAQPAAPILSESSYMHPFLRDSTTFPQELSVQDSTSHPVQVDITQVSTVQGGLQQLMRDMTAGLFPSLAPYQTTITNGGDDYTEDICADGYQGGSKSEFEGTQSSDAGSSDEEEDSDDNDLFPMDATVASDTIEVNVNGRTPGSQIDGDGFFVEEEMTLDGGDESEDENPEAAHLIYQDEENFSGLGGCGCDGKQLSQDIFCDYLEDEATLNSRKSN